MQLNSKIPKNSQNLIWTHKPHKNPQTSDPNFLVFSGGKKFLPTYFLKKLRNPQSDRKGAQLKVTSRRSVGERWRFAHAAAIQSKAKRRDGKGAEGETRRGEVRRVELSYATPRSSILASQTHRSVVMSMVGFGGVFVTGVSLLPHQSDVSPHWPQGDRRGTPFRERSPRWRHGGYWMVDVAIRWVRAGAAGLPIRLGALRWSDMVCFSFQCNYLANRALRKCFLKFLMFIHKATTT